MSDVVREPIFLAAARGEATASTPVWFMRQAGRSLPEYRAIRGEGSILDAIKRPELAAEITLQPVRRYGVDAAVLFSDIVVPAHAVGFGIDVAPGTGPVANAPLRRRSDLDRLRMLEPYDIAYVTETVRLVAADLGATTPVLAFAGAPFTVASYLIEGRPSRTYEHTKALMHGDEALWHDVMDRLASMAITFIDVQLGAGPRTIGLDWRTTISGARKRFGDQIGMQGNLDPALVLGGTELAIAGTDRVLADNAGRPGHVFNLGHGVHPSTDPNVLAAVVERVRAHTS